MPSSRSRSTVSTRAMSLRTWRMRIGLPSCPTAFWKRRLKSSALSSSTLRTRSSRLRSLSSRAFTDTLTTLLRPDDAGPDRQLEGGQPQRLHRDRLGHARHLEEDASRLDDGDPVLGRPLAAAHARLGRLLGDGLVGKDPDPELAAALDLPGDGDAGRLDLLRGDPARLQGLQRVLAGLDGDAPRGRALH